MPPADVVYTFILFYMGGIPVSHFIRRLVTFTRHGEQVSSEEYAERMELWKRRVGTCYVEVSYGKTCSAVTPCKKHLKEKPRVSDRYHVELLPSFSWPVTLPMFAVDEVSSVVGEILRRKHVERELHIATMRAVQQRELLESKKVVRQLEAELGLPPSGDES